MGLTNEDYSNPPDSPIDLDDSPSNTGASAQPHDGHDLQQLLALARNPPPGASVYSPEATVSPALNPRSCVTCRRRKVRCDKHMPCSNCRRAKIPCVFPAPGRAPRRPRPKDPNAPPKQPSSERELELMKRLRKLEGIVEELSGQIEVEGGRHSSTAGSPEAPLGHEGDAAGGSAEGSVAGSGGSLAGRLVSGQNSAFGPLKRSSSEMVTKQFGRLMLNGKGLTRYVSSGYWSKINDELDEIRQESLSLTEDDSEESDVETSPESAILQDKMTSDHQSFILGYRSADVDLRPLHPLPSQIPFMWQIFQENVDSIVKVLHIPTMNKLIRDVRNNLDSLTPSTEALMFSIYYAAMTSMNEDEVNKNFGAGKDFLVSQYRFALEQALAKANFLIAPDLTVCQAFLIFLVLVRRHDDTRFSWALTGLIIRISQAIGLHRDGTNFSNLTPFEIEMRRRLFWQVAILDLRSAEDQGTDLTLVDRMFDTQLPLNINDSDISPDSKELPKPRVGPTDMTFSLIRYEICSLARRLHTASSAMANVCPNDASQSLEEREAMLAETYHRVEHTYLKGTTIEDNPIYWVAATIARVIVAKITLVIYQPLLFPGPSNGSLPTATRDRLFRAAIDIFEYNHLLNTDPRSEPWRWLFKTYTQWHAVAYVLLEVSHRPWSATAERAWAALTAVFTAPKAHEIESITDHTAVWQPFKKLFMKAKKHREAEIARLRADPEAALKLDFEERSRTVPTPNFGSLPGSVKNAIAHERWRKLVNAPPMSPDMLVANTLLQRGGSQTQVQTAPTGNALPRSPTSGVDEEQLMQFVGETLSNRHVVPADFLPAVFGLTEGMTDPARLGMYGFGGPGDIPRADTMINSASTSVAPSQGQGSGDASAYPGSQMIPSNTFSNDDNPPPWLWSPAPSQEPSQFAETRSEDMDVNMDEGFNWQGFQEDLSKFEIANGGSTVGWATGF